MSKEKASKSKMVFKLDSYDPIALPFVNVVFQELLQTVVLYTEGSDKAVKKLRVFAEEIAAWRVSQEQNAINGFTNAEQRVAEKQQEWDKWQQEATALSDAHPHLSKTDICKIVAKNHGVCRKAVSDRVINVGKPRKPRKST